MINCRERPKEKWFLQRLDDWVHVVVGEEPENMLQLKLISFTTGLQRKLRAGSSYLLVAEPLL